MKLELKHLAPYLPYGLKVKSKRHFCKYGEETILKVNGIAFQDTANIPYWQYEFIYDNDLKFSDINEKNFKPILRPLSDLTKEIQVNGENFIPSKEYSYLRFDEISNYKGGQNVLNFIQVREQNILLELHFDIFGLIEKGLAIDINTL